MSQTAPFLLAHRYLLIQLARREVLLRYRGSVLGIGWSFLHPLLLLLVFTLVFGGVFGGRWDSQTSSKTGFDMALFIYCGLAVFTPFSEVISSAPRILFAHQHLVRKVVFPVELLPLTSFIAANVHAAAHFVLLILAVALHGKLEPTALLLPLVLLPAWLTTLGLAWMFAAAGAYVRDIGHGMPVLTQLMMFGMPVFYPSTASPGLLQTLNYFNPIAQSIENLRRIMLEHAMPNWSHWGLMLALSLICVLGGHLFFKRCREEFADVL